MRFYSDDPVRDFDRWDAEMERNRMRHRRGRCIHCDEDIYEGEPHYDIDGDLLHEDCLWGWAQEYKR